MSTRQPLFSANPHGRNLVLNFRQSASQELECSARAFHQAGGTLAQQLLFPGCSFNDLDGIPVVFLYRHALELYLKALIRIGNHMLNQSGEAPIETATLLQEHPLLPLLKLLDQIFKRLKLEFDPWNFEIEGLRCYSDLQALITEWDIVDEGSFTFGYSTDGNEPALARHFQFYLPTFCEVMDQVLGQLDAMATGLNERRRRSKVGRSGKGKLATK